MSKWSRRLVVVLGLGLVVAACATPTIPLPPPSPPTAEPSTTAGKYKLSSVRGAEPNALIVIYNRNPAVPLGQRVGGAEADGAGSWATEVTASAGDTLDITQEFGSTRSPPVTIRLR